MCELPFVKKCSWERQNDRRNSLDRTLKILNLAKMVLKLTFLFCCLLPLVITVSSMAGGDDSSAGLGIGFSPMPDGFLLVQFLSPDGPAQKAGVKVNDRLVAIEGRDIRTIRQDQLTLITRGAPGSKVKLLVQSPMEQPREVTVTRAKVTPPVAAGGPDQPARPPAANIPPENPLDPKPASLPRGVQKFHQVSLKDPAVKQIEALRFLVPDGWTAEGKIDWYPTMMQTTQIQLRIADAKSKVSIQFLPGQNFTSFVPPMPVADWSNQNGKIFLSRPITDPVAFVQAFWMPRELQHLRTGRLVNQTRLPKLEAELMRQFAGPGQAIANRLRYEYSGENNQPWEEDVTFGLIFSGQQVVSWQVGACTSVRAPKGQIDAQQAAIAAVLASFEFNPEWSATVYYTRQGWLNVIRESINQDIAMGRIQQQYLNEIHALGQQIQQDRWAHEDKIAESRREVLGGVETYHDAYTDRNFYMPAGAKGYWTNNKGEFLVTDQAAYDPNAGSTIEWKRMDRRDPMAR